MSYSPFSTKPVIQPVQFTEPQFRAQLKEASALIRVQKARNDFQVSGAGHAVAVIDTGLRMTHEDFKGRVPTQHNFTADNAGDSKNATDGGGHGTHVAGIIAANSTRHLGMAPDAQVIPLKVLRNHDGGGDFSDIAAALAWVIENHTTHNITVVCMSLGDGGNYTNDTGYDDDVIRQHLATLKTACIAVVVAAGNDYYEHNSQQGMSYPSILRDCISVGAVYDANIGSFTYNNGAVARETGPDRITPFSQRLHSSVNPNTRTDIFAPGAPITSSGITNDKAEAVHQGTSQATPVIAGVVLLMQEFYKGTTGALPAVDDLVQWMRLGGVEIIDGDNEVDNVRHTGLRFIRVDAFGALDSIRRHLQVRMLTENRAFRGSVAIKV